MRVCSKCGSPLNEDAVFCHKCGSRIVTPTNVWECSSCGTSNSDEQNYCVVCGAARENNLQQQNIQVEEYEENKEISIAENASSFESMEDDLTLETIDQEFAIKYALKTLLYKAIIVISSLGILLAGWGAHISSDNMHKSFLGMFFAEVFILVIPAILLIAIFLYIILHTFFKALFKRNIRYIEKFSISEYEVLHAWHNKHHIDNNDDRKSEEESNSEPKYAGLFGCLKWTGIGCLTLFLIWLISFLAVAFIH